MNLIQFLNEVTSIYETGSATEHSYRSALQTLLSSIGDDITALNEPKRVKCGAPDFIVSQGDIIIGHVEAKDIPIDIRKLKDANKDQAQRYKAALPNLIYTNCLDWDFYRDGELVASITIADMLMGIQPKPERFETLQNLLQDFAAQRPQTITSPRDLAERMAGKANLIKDVLGKTLADDADLQSELTAQFQAFQENLIHDITPADFADIYAETIAYGMFAARLHDQTLDTFSRQEALELLPKSNPFLRSLFTYVAGYDLDDRIAWIIDDLARVFRACDVAKLMEGFGKLTGQNDPFLHFYETFLAAYNPKKRKARGVWYTPEPVVNFIVRAVDEVLQTEFGLADGLADTSKVTIDWDTGQTDKKGKPVTVKKDVHRVQVLDPATGTGTFLAEVIKQIAPKVQGVAPGMWSQYIEDDLIPRLHGFELLMASYAMCHMKLDMILTELGYQPKKNPPRLSVYLTNSLEEGEPANQSLPFSQWLSREAKGANTIKRDMPIMCVIGNPPYSGHSSNKGEWISDLVEDYKRSPELRAPGQGKWLSDDYVKFIRYAEHMISKSGEGVLGFITNHSYLDNPTFFDMRHHLMESFDEIFVYDLHGSVKRSGAVPEHLRDANVFDIQQGVAILVAIKRKHGQSLTRVKARSVVGSRKSKYLWLSEARIRHCSEIDVTPEGKPWLFVEKDWNENSEYLSFPRVPDLFSPYGKPAPAVLSTHDQFAVSWSEPDALKKVEMLIASQSEDEARLKFRLCSQDQWSFEKASKELSVAASSELLTPIDYRLFDRRTTIYDRNVFVHRRERLNAHMRSHTNLALVTCRQTVGKDWHHTFIASAMLDDSYLSNRSKERGYGFPLYLYPDVQDLDQTRRVNFDPKLWKKLQKLAKHPTHGTPDEVQTFDYIYGVLHCPAYRDTYAEFLKIDFPRIPWPTSPDAFWDISAKGTQLRQLHLMEPAAIGPAP
ncbi:MAG: type ISP restriction/modification enzyme, partial [Pseudomonadota bacterium]